MRSEPGVLWRVRWFAAVPHKHHEDWFRTALNWYRSSTVQKLCILAGSYSNVLRAGLSGRSKGCRGCFASLKPALDVGLRWHRCLVPSGRTAAPWSARACAELWMCWGGSAGGVRRTAGLSGRCLCPRCRLCLRHSQHGFQPRPAALALPSGCLVGAVPQLQQGGCWALPWKAGQPRRCRDALGCALLAESKPLQLRDVTCVPSWELSLCDKRGDLPSASRLSAWCCWA